MSEKETNSREGNQQNRSAKCTERKKSLKNSSSSYGKPELDITKDEFDRIKVALEKQEFRKLFMDYIDEIQDPENRKRYEDEIRQFEAERGVEVTFIHPTPGFVIKTSQDGNLKCFINCAQSENIGKPIHQTHTDPNTGLRGLHWSLPLAQGPPNDDLDNNKRRCVVYDVVFHPNALHMAKNNKAFHRCVVDTALDAVEKEYGVKLDRVNLKFPKMQFKGVARPTVIRRLAKNTPPETEEPHPLESIYPPKPIEDDGELKVLNVSQSNAAADKKAEYCVPKYTIKYRKAVDMAEYTNELDAKLYSTIPTDLIVEIDLPLLNSSADCQLDVTNRTVFLVSERIGAKYHLIVNLPHTVNDKEGCARFDTDARRLIITLPVVQKTVEEQRNMHNALLHFGREDSGVESDIREDVSSSNTPDSPIEELELDMVADSLPGDNFASNEENNAKIENEILVQTPFLNPSIAYQLPSTFQCNRLNETISWVLNVKNVEIDSLQLLWTARSLHLQFATIGSGYYPIHYAFYIQLPSEYDDIEILNADAKAWEQNVILNMHLNSDAEHVRVFLLGLDKDNLEEYEVDEVYQATGYLRPRKNHSCDTVDDESPVKFDVSVQRLNTDETIEIDIKPLIEYQDDDDTGVVAASNSTDAAEEELAAASDVPQLNKKSKRKCKNRRSLSESACDDIKAYHQQQQQQEQQSQQQHSALLSADASDADISEINNNNNKAKNASTEVMENAIKSMFATSASVNVPTTSASAAASKAAKKRIQRSLSESRGSIICGSVSSASYKGILKHYSHYDPMPFISDSCSSIDDYSSNYSTSADGVAGNLESLRYSRSCNDAIPEENAAAVARFSESNKKTVRFSEVIKKQVFRLDSSILGQRKKNQKRRNRKLRALQRRHSEGDSVDYEEHKSPASPPMHNFKTKSNSNNKKINTNNNNNTGTNGSNKNYRNGKGKKNSGVNSKSRKNRRSHDSESSSDVDGGNKNALIFHMDM